ncbi:MAG: transporter suffix domain-containing protein [Prolixibacteraceae bacterium]
MKKSLKFKTGLFLVIACVPFFLAIPVVPFLKLDSGLKITLTTVFLVVGEIMFWSGGLLLGKELLTKYKSYFNPRNWKKK